MSRISSRICAALLLASLLASSAQAANPSTPTDLAGHALIIGADGSIKDAQSAAFTGEVAMTVGTVYAAARSLKAICTVAGNISVTYVDTSVGVWAVQVGTQTLPVSITAVNASGTTATCTYANLK